MPPSPIFFSILYSPTTKPGTRSVVGGCSSTGAACAATAALGPRPRPPVGCAPPDGDTGGWYVASTSMVNDHPSSGHAVMVSGHCFLHLRQTRIVPSQDNKDAPSFEDLGCSHGPSRHCKCA